jgi:hypothetical protein
MDGPPLPHGSCWDKSPSVLSDLVLVPLRGAAMMESRSLRDLDIRAPIHVATASYFAVVRSPSDPKLNPARHRARSCSPARR